MFYTNWNNEYSLNKINSSTEILFNHFNLNILICFYFDFKKENFHENEKDLIEKKKKKKKTEIIYSFQYNFILKYKCRIRNKRKTGKRFLFKNIIFE